MKVTRKMCSDGGHAIKENFNLPFLILKVMNELRFTFIGGWLADCSVTICSVCEWPWDYWPGDWDDECDILCRYHTYTRSQGIKHKRQWVKRSWMRCIDHVLVVLSSGPLPRGQSALVVRLVLRRSWLEILVESPDSFLVASLSHRTLSSVEISWGM